MTYEEFELSEIQLDDIKKRHQRLEIVRYIKEYGVEPSDISQFYTATEDELETRKRNEYARYMQNIPQQQNNEIWYTSNDGNIVELYEGYEGVQPISNTYSGGKGVMVFADELTSIGSGAFRGCGSLTSITIPSSVTSIEGGAFMECGSLMSITIPSSVTSIGNYAFESCRSLMSITFSGTVAQWNAITKGYYLYDSVPAGYAQCTDGQVRLYYGY